jgi:MFS family permease
MLTGRKKGLAAVIASMVVVNLVYGLTLPLLSLVLDAQGISKTIIGLSIVAQACAGVLIAPFASQLIVRVGAARIMQFATLLAAATLVILGAWQDVYAWFFLLWFRGRSRFCAGAAGVTGYGNRRHPTFCRDGRAGDAGQRPVVLAAKRGR